MAFIKYSCAKTIDGRLAFGYFLKPYFFTMPIILDALHIPRDFSFSFFMYEKLQIENSCLRMCSATYVTRGECDYGGLRDKWLAIMLL